VPDLDDYELLQTDAPHAVVRRRPPVVWIAIVVLAIAGLTYFVYSSRPARQPPPAAAARTPERIEKPPAPLGGVGEPVTLPPLDESDPIVRDLVRKITSNPLAEAWLSTKDLVRSFTVVVENIVEGVTPAKHLSVLRPKSAFRVEQRNGQLFIDPSSYSRYDGIAAAAASIDPAGAARVYATLKPRIAEAYSQLGLPGDTFDRALERAIVALLSTPVVDGPVRVEPQGGVAYRYADSNLEGLTAAQKQLLRTGPRNMRTIQSALRQIALGLGIPAERLRDRNDRQAR